MNQSISQSIPQSVSQTVNQSHRVGCNNRLTKAQDVFLVEDNLLRKTRYWNQTNQNQKSCFWIFFGQSRLSNPFWILQCVCTASGITPDRNPIPSTSDRNSQSYSRIFWACVWILRSRSFGSNRSYIFCSMNCCQYRCQATQLPIPDSYLFLDSWYLLMCLGRRLVRVYVSPNFSKMMKNLQLNFAWNHVSNSNAFMLHEFDHGTCKDTQRRRLRWRWHFRIDQTLYSPSNFFSSGFMCFPSQNQLLIQHCQKMPRLNLEIDMTLDSSISQVSSSFLEDVKYTNLAGRIVPCGKSSEMVGVGGSGSNLFRCMNTEDVNGQCLHFLKRIATKRIPQNRAGRLSLFFL